MAMLHLPRQSTPQPVMLLIAERLNVVRALGISAVLFGALLAANGAAVLAVIPYFASLPGWPWLYGVVLAISGGSLVITNGRRWHRTAGVSATLCAAVYGVLVAGFLAHWAAGAISSPPYPSVIYGLAAYLHLVHADVERRVVHASAHPPS